MDIYFATAPMTIGRHEWRCVVRDSASMPKSRATEMQWRGVHGGDWRPQREWPTFNVNDGEFLGLPRSLVKLYRRHKADITGAIKVQEPAQAAQQMSLF